MYTYAQRPGKNRDLPSACQSVALRISGAAGAWRTQLVTPSITLFGYVPEDFLSGRVGWQDVIHPEDLPGLIRMLEDFEARGIDSFTTYYRIRTGRGEPLSVSDSCLTVRNHQNVPLYSDRIISSLDDSLTGLPGPQSLDAQLGDAYRRALDTGAPGCVLSIDLDDFGEINSSYGVDVGDELLRQFAARLRDDFPGCKAYRHGGDQFVLVVPEGREIYGIVEKLTRRSRQPWVVDGKSIYCTHTVGIAQYPDASRDPRAILQNADLAMHLAKKKGRDTCYFHQDAKVNHTLVRTRIEQRLRDAVNHGCEGMAMHYQPLVDLTGRVLGAEALLRWRTPEGEWIPPDEFIPIAEQTGVIVEIGRFAFEQAVRLCRRVNEVDPEFFMSVNVSQRQMQEPGFVPAMLACLRESGCRGANLYLEITEGMAMKDISQTAGLCREFRRHQLGISMDDFGTGYSALGHLRSLPLDVVKIDRIFTKNLESDHYSRTLVRMMTELVHSLGLRLCVEGVETRGQWDFCRACGIDYMQGYLFSRPLPGDELLPLASRELAHA